MLAQVWGKWPGHVLIAIFLFHFAATGLVVALHARRCLAPAQPATPFGQCLRTSLIAVVCVLGAPFIPAMFVLDTLAFAQHLFIAITQVMHLPIFSKCCSPSSAVTWPFTHIGRVQCIDLENYEEMHNMIAAAFQSLPTVILNSVLFSLGNKPSHGISLSNRLFVAAIVASCLAILKTIAVLLWQAHRTHTSPLRQLIDMMSGRTLSTLVCTIGQPQHTDISPGAEVTMQLNTHPNSGHMSSASRAHALQELRL